MRRALLMMMAAGVLLLGADRPDSAQAAASTTSLGGGWNHVCYIGAQQALPEALGQIASSVQALYSFREGGALDRWFPGRPEVSTISSLTPFEPLLMLVDTSVDWVQSGDQAAPEVVEIQQGWDAICYEGKSRETSEALDAVDGNIAIVYSLVPGQGWLRFVPGRADISNLDRLEPHQALLVLVNDAAGATWRFTGEEAALPPLTPFDPALATKLHEIRDRMSSIRGLPPNTEAQEGTVTRAALTQYYQQQADLTRQEEGEEFEVRNAAFRLLHLIGPEDDLLDIFTAFGSNVLGFYSPEDDEIVLVAEEAKRIDENDEPTLAHEYVHSFQDARWDIQKLEQLADDEQVTRSNTEYSATVSCLIEGDAQLSELLYAVAIFGANVDEVRAAGRQAGETEIPPAISRYLYFPYIECAAFVTDLYSQGGWGAVDNAYADMPKSTEQVLHPEKYTSHELPAELTLPDLSAQLGSGWEQVDHIVFGEYDVYNYLLTSLEGQPDWDSEATAAAAGWGGGRIATYAQADTSRVVLHLSLQWDSGDDRQQFVEAFLKVAATTAGLWWPNDPAMDAVRWESATEHGFATWQDNSVVVLLSASADDLRTAVSAAGYSLDAATEPSLPAPPQ
jgi:hypothetical protein